MRLVAASLLLLASIAAIAQTPKAGPNMPSPPNKPADVAGIPVNYDESAVGTYTLPDPLRLTDGTPVTTAMAWRTLRRPQIVRMFETQQFGIAPPRPASETFDVFDKGTPALNGKAIRKQVTIYLTKDKTGRHINLVEYLPAGKVRTKKATPMLLSINFGPPQMAFDDPGIKPVSVWDPKTGTLGLPASKVSPTRSLGRLNADIFLDAGIGIATFYYGDVEPDFAAGFKDGVRTANETSNDDRPADAWGSIAAWAWGMSRVQDYFETDKDIDAKRVAIHGISRLGKTVMWAGAHDERFAAVIASCSGEGGAALSRRNYGETVAHLTAPGRYPYQFARNWAKYAGFPDPAPFDANLLVALVAPRPLLLQTGNTDFWSDPKGEFLSAVSAGPVYRLLGKAGLGTDAMPAAGVPILHDLSYEMHDGGHGMVSSDWPVYVDFLKLYLHPER